MEIETSNAIRLFFPSPSLAQVFFEAVANSFDAGATHIVIKVEIADRPVSDTLKVSISDNGSGFTDDSFARFKLLLNAQDQFHKGLGRLVFLDYFGAVIVESVWDNNRRRFTFSKPWKGQSHVEKLGGPTPNSTTLIFTDFIRERVRSYEDLKPGALKQRLIEQFLPTLHEFARGGREFRIEIQFVTSEATAQKELFSGAETITTEDLPQLREATILDQFVDNYEPIRMFYRVKAGLGEKNILTAVSIDRRTIPIKLLQPGAVPPEHSAIFLFESKLFEGRSDTSRQRLTLPDTVPEADLFRILRREVGRVLAEEIPQIHDRNASTETQFESRFPHLLGLFEKTTVGLIDKDEALEIAQRKFFKAQKEILECEKLDDATFEKSLELSSRTLTEYVLYRQKIIEKMRETTSDNSEADIHNLIVPKRSQFEKMEFADGLYRNNAWLLDDKFMTFQTILSEQRMDKIVEAIKVDEETIPDAGRPDIAMIFSADPEKEAAVDVVVIELKKKTDDEKENQYVMNQLLDRAAKLAAYCTNIQRIWYYAVIDINDTMATRLRQQKWAPLFSQGQVYYQEFPTERPDKKIVPTPMFVVSFDAVVADAECRNHTFLEILRHGMRRYVDTNGRSPEASRSPETTTGPFAGNGHR
jgi:hypothetical protein